MHHFFPAFIQLPWIRSVLTTQRRKYLLYQPVSKSDGFLNPTQHKVIFPPIKVWKNEKPESEYITNILQVYAASSSSVDTIETRRRRRRLRSSSYAVPPSQIPARTAGTEPSGIEKDCVEASQAHSSLTSRSLYSSKTSWRPLALRSLPSREAADIG